MTWALNTAVKHPELKNAMVNSNGDWLDFLLEDGRTFRFRPGALIRDDAPEEQRTELLNRLIHIGLEQAQAPTVAETAGQTPKSSTGSDAAQESNNDAPSEQSAASGAATADGNSAANSDDDTGTDKANDSATADRTDAPAASNRPRSFGESATSHELEGTDEPVGGSDSGEANTPATPESGSTPEPTDQSAESPADNPLGTQEDPASSSGESKPQGRIFPGWASREESPREEPPADAAPLDVPPLDEPDENTPVVPIVRTAEYFLASHKDSDSIVYVPLTEFLAVGLAHDMPDTIQPVYYSQIQDSFREVGELMVEAVEELRGLTNAQRQTVEIGITQIAGARVMSFLQPANYELSWFCDLDMMQQVAEKIAAERPGDIPLFVPASRTKLYIVFADDPKLVDFFKLLLAQRGAAEAVYPLPHTVAADGWREWVPFPGSELSEVLGSLRNYFRQKIYAAQVEAMHKWGEFGELKAFAPRRLKNGERVSVTEWDATDSRGSIPQTDFITFTRQPSPHPWEEVVPVSITVRSHVARELWPAGFTKDDDAWPPRWEVNGFPDDDTLNELKDATGRDF